MLFSPSVFFYLIWINEAKTKAYKPIMSVGVMEYYKLRDLRASHTLSKNTWESHGFMDKNLAVSTPRGLKLW